MSNLLKLVMSSTATTSLGPTKYTYFYTMATQTNSTTFNLPVASFVNDTNVAATTLSVPSSNGYYYVTVNGLMQQQNTATFSSSSLTLSFDTATTIFANEVIELACLDYLPVTTITTA